MSSKVVAIIGATGNQGGSIIRALSSSQAKYQLRGLTRAVDKPAAQALVSQGVQMFKGDISTPTSLSDFFKGADVVFAVTNFWEHLSKEQEIKDGKAIVDMAKECHVSLLIWSSLDDVSKVSKGKYTHVDHFDGKHAVEEYARSVEQPAVFFYAGCFASNFSAGGMGPKKQEDGSYVMAFPVPGSTIIPIFDVADTGMFIAGILNGPEKMMGQRVLGFSEFISLNDMVKQYSSVRGVQAKFVQIDYDTYEAHFPNKTVAKELYEMFAYMNEFGYYGETTDEEVRQSHEMCVGKPTTWSEFVSKTEWND
ncbi:hypothetical protein YB2330_002628 [Saitoella coloradoensis]